MTNPSEKLFLIRDYDLAATLTSGQAFRWQPHIDAWIGIIHGRWVQLRSKGNSIVAQVAEPVTDWSWLTHYLQIETDLASILASFPDDEALRSSIAACRGLRLLRQDPWETLASFILSSTKQIVQIRQIIALLSRRFGDPLRVPTGHEAVYNFPSPARLAALTEAELRDCKMGFRAPYLLAASQAIASDKLNLARLKEMSVVEARAELVSLPGVGPKIADCVLLFAYGFPNAFPVDVWVMKALRELYFPKRKPSREKLQRFIDTYFGQNSGYAQQYLFHYMRIHRPTRG